MERDKTKIYPMTVKFCEQCPAAEADYDQEYNVVLFCTEVKDRKKVSGSDIPKWCPLEDKK